MILIISQNKRKATALSDILYYMGVLSLGVTPKEALSEISPDYSAVIVTNPEILPDAADFVKRLRRYASDTPIFSVSDSTDNASLKSLFNLSLPDSIYSTTMIAKISLFCLENGKRAPGAYSIAGIDAGCDLSEPLFFDEKVALTKTETMILRYLIRIYPRKAKAAQILTHAFKSGRNPEPSSVRTHISVMNKKFRQSFSHPIISSSEGGGYTVLTPEYYEKKAESCL